MLARLRHGLRFAGVLTPSLLLLLGVTSCRRETAHRPVNSLPAAPIVLTTSPSPSPSPSSSSSPADSKPAADADNSAAQMSDPERKSAARAAFAEGVQLQDRRDCVQALPRFEVAERLFDAPTHLLHMAQCQTMVGRLIEAQESYATLAHTTLGPQSPPAFRDAIATGRAEAARLSPRVPTLRVETSPSATSLKNVIVKVNGTQMPADLIGVARPLNPGKYHVTVTAAPGRSGAGDTELREGEAKSLEVKLSP